MKTQQNGISTKNSSPELRTYQKEDAKFLASIPQSACFNEQRTGKTPTALETIKLRNLDHEKILIITTASSIYQWKEEYEKWLNRPCEICIGTPTQKKKAIDKWTHGLVISLDSFKETKNRKGLIDPILSKNPKMVILDEAHKIKNPKSANAAAIFKTRGVPYRLALTGTPAQGKPYDVFSILKFLFPDDFRSYWKFIDEYFIIEDRTVYQNGKPRTFKYYERFKPGMDKELQKYLATFSTQRKRKDVMPWLPDKFYQRVRLSPTKEQKKYLKELEDTYRTGDIVTTGTLDRLVRYRQICLDPGLLDLKGKSSKTEWILQYLKDYPDEQVIIFSKFTSYLIHLSEQLETTWAMLVGATSIKQRGQFIKDFQAGKFKVFLINIDAGKEALTLDAAETTIFTDKYPPIGSIEQAEDRFIASTQDKAHKAHKIIELMIADTFDEQLYKLLEQRKSETDIINNYNKYLSERRNENERTKSSVPIPRSHKRTVQSINTY
jgi:SNF2 family DNA or RNA helicase